MENPPHNQYAIFSPTTGTAVTRLVITVAPQKLICPQGKIYPKKEVAIINTKIITPELHNNCLGYAKEPNNKLLNMCKYTTKKNTDAPFECKYLITQPYCTSLKIYSTLANAKSMSLL